MRPTTTLVFTFLMLHTSLVDTHNFWPELSPSELFFEMMQSISMHHPWPLGEPDDYVDTDDFLHELPPSYC
jgi:hypothetical protein